MATTVPVKNLYLSFDIEADGPSPCKNNMLSLGICGLDSECNEVYKYEANLSLLDGHEADEDTMRRFWAVQVEAWEYVNTNRITCVEAMERLAADLVKLKDEGWRITWVAQPAAYDWQWLNYYWHYATGHGAKIPPGVMLGFKADCISTMYSMYVRMRKLEGEENNKLWNELYGVNPAKHMAYYDARHQGYVYVKLLKLM